MTTMKTFANRNEMLNGSSRRATVGRRIGLQETVVEFSTADFNYSKDLRTFIEEISMLEDKVKSVHGWWYKVILKNPKTGDSRTFVFSHADKDGSGEDIYGWNYESTTDDLKLLIIND